MNWITNLFWTPRTASKEKTSEDAKTFLANFAATGNFCGDNLVCAGRNLGFLEDDPFMSAFHGVIDDSNFVGKGIIWRLYTFCWCAKSALRIDGDLVECGVSWATSSRIMVDYLRFENQPKQLFLYDLWDPNSTQIDTSAYMFNQDTFETVRSYFSRYKNVTLVKGFIPDSLEGDSPSSISFLHLDMNNAEAEINALECLFGRITKGGIILLDDYGASGFREQYERETEWFAKRGYRILELPTGQGLVIK
jgi:O-methyltransferase